MSPVPDRRAFDHAPLARCVVRVPLLPFDTLVAWSAEPRDVATVRARLQAIVADPVIREALFVASPELDVSLDGWLADPDAEAARGVEQTLVRYLSRMAGRATPFGLFSSLGVGTVGSDATTLAIAPREQARRHARLDHDYLSSATAALGAQPEVRAQLVYRPSSSLYTAAGHLRYAEVRHEPARAYHLVDLEPTDYLVAVLARAATGATLAELVVTLCEDPEIGTDDAEAFLGQLVDTQVLVSDLEPPVTGREPAAPLAEELAVVAPSAGAALAAATARLHALDAAPLGADPAVYRALVDDLAAVPTPPRLDRLVQIDLHRATNALAVGGAVGAEVTRGLALLHRCGGHGDDDGLGRFRAAFGARYEQREVPLVEALDDEIGVGFGPAKPMAAPLLEVAPPTRPGTRQAAWTKRDVHLLRLVLRAATTGAHRLELTGADADELARDPRPRLADSFVAPIAIAASSPAALADGDFQVRLLQADAPAARMLGRFCHGDADIEAITRELVLLEEARRPDAAFAEIAHLPEGRLGNVLVRPLLRAFEIPYLGRSGVPRAQQIPVTDLLVSVVDGRVVLRSQRLGREVVPRLTSAHNYVRGSLGLYRFLGTLANQDGVAPVWQWGALGDAPFLPRVTSGRVVLTRARWLLGAAELAALKAAKPAVGIAALRAHLGWPRWLLLAEGDNELPIDLDNPLAVASFAQLLRGMTTATLFEQFPAPDALGVTAPDGRYVHEIQLFYARPAAPVVTATTPARASAAPLQRSFPPGSAWLYLKYYAGSSVQDALLRELAPVLHALVESGAASHWFYLRYADPDPHLRLRLAGDPLRLVGTVLPQLARAIQPAVESGIVWRTQLDTYEREVERYGGAAAIEHAERAFAADSVAALAILDAVAGDDGAALTWRAAAVGIDRLLDDLGFDFDAKRAELTRLRDQFGAEVGMDTDHQRRLGEKYRRVRGELESALTGTDAVLAPAHAALSARSERIRPLAAKLTPAVAPHLVHMHVNRLLAASPRAQELVLYDLLRRHYDAVVGRRKQSR